MFLRCGFATAHCWRSSSSISTPARRLIGSRKVDEEEEEKFDGLTSQEKGKAGAKERGESIELKEREGGEKMDGRRRGEGGERRKRHGKENDLS